MTTPTQPEQTAGEQPNKLAGGCVIAISATIASGIAVAVPETAYYVAGLLTAAGVRRARTWAAGRRRKADEEQPEPPDRIDILAVLHELSPCGTANVRLTQIVEATGLPDTKSVRALLAEADIPIKEVRTGGTIGPGVYHSAIPRSCDAPPDSCWCAVTSNNNTNNTAGEDTQEGLRVHHIGHGGRIITDPAETITRHHATTK